ncbi:MAG TPA: hypothetical protein VLY65_00875, partial [Nitrososphaerales archaeon]|nr:hypothetical protein [Nitrososphaerales archaeon]
SYANNPSISLGYMNNQEHSQQVSFYATLRNGANQTLQLVKMKGTLAAGRTSEMTFTFSNQPDGCYTITVFATSPKGMPLSTPFRLLLTSTEVIQQVTSSARPGA